MAKQSVEIDTTELRKLFKNFSALTGKSIPDLVREHARICAVELANRTQPFSMGKGVAKSIVERGKNHLKKDILKPVKDEETLRKKADGLRNEKLRLWMQEVVNSGSNEVIAKLLVRTKTILNISNFLQATGSSNIKAAHQSNRSKTTGRSLSSYPVYNYAKSDLGKYVDEVSRMIGYSKGGWAHCAREIGGVKGDGARGIPAFAKKKKFKNGRVANNLDDKTNPHFVMTNTTPWLSRILTKSQQDEATGNTRVKMIKSMRRLIRQVLKERKNAATATAQIISKID
jgi:hypothetical protein